nr:SDR family NAD(P)-dependent oxidoreductase [Kibdelosporangium sp. MJ126-NF4]CTQ90775.1 Non-ribosomal peptide synthetase [Kibdelosporangium sp. MJ126-NF4]
MSDSDPGVLAFPASFAQERMWFLHKLSPGDPYYNIPLVFGVDGVLDIDTVKAALRAVIGRHEALRTTFTENDGELSQVVAEQPSFGFDVVDVPFDGDAATATRTPRIATTLLDWIREPMDLGAGPLVRCLLLRLAPDRHLLVFCMHHIIIDGWSLNIVAEEFGMAYRACASGAPVPFEELPIQYADFAEWQRDRLRDEVLAEHLGYWRDRLAGELPALRLPLDRPRPEVQSFTGERVDFRLTSELTDAVRQLGRREAASPSMVLLTAFAVLLRRHSGHDDIVIGSPVAGRESEQVKPLVGLFVNTLALRVGLAGDPSFTELVRRVREVAFGAYEHQDVPLDKIVDEVRPERRAGRGPLFDVLFAVQNAPKLDIDLGTAALSAIQIERFSTRFDLELHFWEQRDHFTSAFVFNTALFDTTTVRGLTNQLLSLLESAVAEPDQPVSRLPLRAAREAGWLRSLAEGRQAHLNGRSATLADIATTVTQDEAVRECVISVARGESGMDELIAYVVPVGPFAPGRLADLVRSEWPDAVVPSGWVAVSAIPLTATGEVDVAVLDRIPVLDESVRARWQDVFGQRAHVVIEDDVRPAGRIHLGRLPSALGPASSGPAVESPADAAIDGQPAIAHGPRLPDIGITTLDEALLRAVHGDIVYVGSDGGDQRQSYAELAEDAARLLGGLRRIGVRPGDLVIFQLERNADFVAAFWACVLGGFVAVPLAVPPVYDQPNSAVDKFANAWRMLDAPWVLTSARHEADIRGLGWRDLRMGVVDLLRTSEPDHDRHPNQAEDPVLMLLTSGSTGAPKAVVQRHSSIIARSVATATANHFGAADVSFNWMPLDHVGGIVMFHIRDVVLDCRQVHAPIHWVLEKPLRWLDCVDKYRATVTWAPNFAYGLVNDRAGELADRHWDLSCLRFILNAGEAIMAKVARTFVRVLAPHGLPGSAMHPAWGMSETSSAVTYSDRFTLESTSDDDSFVSVGAPVPGTSVRIVDEHDQLMTEGQAGRLQVKGPTVTTGYHDNPEQNAKSFTADGWFDTGDLGFLRDGRLTITGRAKDVVIVNGINYFSHEIESVAEELDSVENSFTAACGVRAAGGTTDQLVVFFHVRAGFTEADVLRDVRAQVVRRAGISPSYVIPVAKDEIPKTEIGKIQRSALAARFADGGFDDAVRRVDLITANERTLPSWFYRRTWHERIASGPVDASSGSLVLLDSDGLGDRLCDALEQRGGRCVRVESGTVFDRHRADRYTIDPGVRAQYERLLEAVAADGIRIDRIIDLRTHGPASGGEPTAEPLLALARLVTATAVKAPGDNKTALYVVSSNSQAISADDTIDCSRLPISGYLKSAAQELAWLRCVHIDLATADHEAAVRSLLREVDSAGPDAEIAYRGSRRLVSRIAELDTTTGGGLPHGGHYVISGGLGGLGVAVAETLLSTYGASLLLLGRSELAGEQAEAYRALRALGDVEYVAADVRDTAQVQRAVDGAEARWASRLTGVFHLAGLFEEQFAVDQSDDDLAAVLAPKMLGAWALHQVVKDRPGVLFVSFSSANGFFGGARVSAYSAANSFLDGFAAYQRSQGIDAYSLAWGMWDEIGMSRGYALKDLTRARGFHLLGRGDGLRSIPVAIGSGEPHVLIGLDRAKPWIRGHVHQSTRPLRKLVGQVTSQTGPADSVVHDRFGRPVECELRVVAPADTPATDKIGPGTGAERTVASVWSRVLGIDNIGSRDSFFDLGGNSLQLTRVQGLLEQAVGRSVELVDLFRHPTVSALAEFLGASDTEEAPAPNRGRQRAERRLRARGQS